MWQFPKKNFLKDFLIAIAEGDEPFLAEHVSDGIIWENIGIKKVETKSLYLKELPNHPLWKTDQLAVDKIITHGTDAAAHGIFHAPDGSAHAFCDIYLFKGFKSLELLSIKSFLIPLT